MKAQMAGKDGITNELIKTFAAVNGTSGALGIRAPGSWSGGIGEGNLISAFIFECAVFRYGNDGQVNRC